MTEQRKCPACGKEVTGRNNKKYCDALCRKRHLGRGYASRYYKKNKLLCNARVSEWIKNNPDKRRIQKQREYKKHSTQIKARVRLYAKNNPDKVAKTERAKWHNDEFAVRSGWPLWCSTRQVQVLNILAVTGLPTPWKEIAGVLKNVRSGGASNLLPLIAAGLVVRIKQKRPDPQLYTLGLEALRILKERADHAKDSEPPSEPD